VQVIPSIDVQGGRSRLVFWPGVASGTGSPTDRPERIARAFVERGARVVHVVDFDGARSGAPADLEIVGRIASSVAVPIQVAGGLESPDAIRLAFAAGATRVVLAMGVVEDPALLGQCLAVAGDWLAVGVDPRPERLAAYPWRRAEVPSPEQLVGELADLGVRRFVLAHAGSGPDERLIRSLLRSADAEILVAGGVVDLDGIRRLRGAGVDGIILGEPLLSGSIDYAAALEAAA
jgi:phosphoribosylformimino-5-aminoimidazole carboxamide ribotide isomerase